MKHLIPIIIKWHINKTKQRQKKLYFRVVTSKKHVDLYKKGFAYKIHLIFVLIYIFLFFYLVSFSNSSRLLMCLIMCSCVKWKINIKNIQIHFTLKKHKHCNSYNIPRCIILANLILFIIIEMSEHLLLFIYHIFLFIYLLYYIIWEKKV